MDATIWPGLLLCVCTLALFLCFILYQIWKITWIKRYGKPVTACITHVNPGKRYLSNRNSIITAKWTDLRTWRTYTFEGISTSPIVKEGALVTVRIDPHHPGRYMMDL